MTKYSTEYSSVPAVTETQNPSLGIRIAYDRNLVRAMAAPSEKLSDNTMVLYALSSSEETKDIFYIGETNNPVTRLRQHLAEAINGNPTTSSRRKIDRIKDLWFEQHCPLVMIELAQSRHCRQCSQTMERFVRKFVVSQISLVNPYCGDKLEFCVLPKFRLNPVFAQVVAENPICGAGYEIPHPDRVF